MNLITAGFSGTIPLKVFCQKLRLSQYFHIALAKLFGTKPASFSYAQANIKTRASLVGTIQRSDLSWLSFAQIWREVILKGPGPCRYICSGLNDKGRRSLTCNALNRFSSNYNENTYILRTFSGRRHSPWHSRQ
jgi:hypothetical protein